MPKVVYSVHIEPLPKGGFYITVPALRNCRTTVKTFNEVLKRAKAEIEKCLRVLATAGKPIPTESQVGELICVPIRVEKPKNAKLISAAELAGE